VRDEGEHKADGEAVEVGARRCRDAEGVRDEGLNELPRHDLLHDDGRRVFVYGELAAGARLAAGVETGLTGIHRRLDLLTDEWVVMSPARNVRPLDTAEDGDEDGCPLCPGGIELPFPYDAAVFENRFPSLVADPPSPPPDELTAPARGRCEMVVYTSRHDTCFGELAPLELGRLLALWIDRSREMWADPRHEFVMIFENRGAEAGATLSHPHGQIYAFDHLPPITAATVEAHRRHRATQGGCLGCELVDRESSSARIVAPNETFAVGVPFAARWPFEVAIRARRHGLARLDDLTPAEQLDLARALRDVALRYDALFAFECPYLMVAQEAPRDEADWHLSFRFLPFQRSRTTTKIRASVETATGLFLNDVLPEESARALAGLGIAAPPLDDRCLFAVGSQVSIPRPLGARS
jgi:UDPglucose--hexose-1-phosphate uridylyltransferase